MMLGASTAAAGQIPDVDQLLSGKAMFADQELAEPGCRIISPLLISADAREHGDDGLRRPRFPS
jgi:hypothetical protein